MAKQRIGPGPAQRGPRGPWHHPPAALRPRRQRARHGAPRPRRRPARGAPARRGRPRPTVSCATSSSSTKPERGEPVGELRPPRRGRRPALVSPGARTAPRRRPRRRPATGAPRRGARTRALPPPPGSASGPDLSAPPSRTRRPSTAHACAALELLRSPRSDTTSSGQPDSRPRTAPVSARRDSTRTAGTGGGVPARARRERAPAEAAERPVDELRTGLHRRHGFATPWPHVSCPWNPVRRGGVSARTLRTRDATSPGVAWPSVSHTTTSTVPAVRGSAAIRTTYVGVDRPANGQVKLVARVSCTRPPPAAATPSGTVSRLGLVLRSQVRAVVRFGHRQAVLEVHDPAFRGPAHSARGWRPRPSTGRVLPG